MTGSQDNLTTTSQATAPEEKKTVYKLSHAILAIAVLLLGSLWLRTFLDKGIFDNYKYDITVFTLAFFAVTVIFFKARGAKLTADAVILLGATAIYSLSFALYPNNYRATDGIALLVIHLTALLFLRCVGNKNTLDSIVGEVLRAAIAEPFLNFHTLIASFSAFFRLKSPPTEDEKEKKRRLITSIGLVIFGIIITLPIAIMVLTLLNSDGFFNNALEDLANFFNGITFKMSFDFWEYFNLITLLVSLFIYGAIFSADKKRSLPAPEAINYAFVPELIVNTVMICVSAIYVLFFITQIDGIIRMLSGSIPEGTTYSSFARSGFFSLCTVACINGGILYCANLLGVKSKNKSLIKPLSYALIGFSLFIILVGAGKMGMYIGAYGFTEKRFCTLWFMLLLTILFVLSVFKLKRADYRLSRYSVYVTLALLAVLFLADLDGISDSLNSLLGYNGIGSSIY